MASNATNHNKLSFDALLPPSMAAKAEAIGVSKACMDTASIFVLAVLAGSFIALGAIFATTVVAGTQDVAPFGVTKRLAGLVFSLGLILVIVGGAELFTGNNLIVMAWASGKVSTLQLLRNWGIVYVGNFVGSVATALILFVSGQYMFGAGIVGKTALGIANAKVNLGFVQAIALGMLCNALVCLAVWLCFSARDTAGKVLAIIPPIAAFVAAGFEHSVANMYFISIGLLIKYFAPASFWTAVARVPGDYPMLTVQAFFANNLLPVTIGNIIGGALMVGGMYWFVYLRKQEPSSGGTGSPLPGIEMEQN